MTALNDRTDLDLVEIATRMSFAELAGLRGLLEAPVKKPQCSGEFSFWL